MTINKKPKTMSVLGCLGVLIVSGVVSYLVLSSDTTTKQPSTTPPRSGYWQGQGVSFTITADRKIENFLLQPETDQRVSGLCEYLQKFPATLKNGQLIAQWESNKVDGIFTTDGQFHGTYSITECGQWKVSLQEGTWDAEWVSDKAP